MTGRDASYTAAPQGAARCLTNGGISTWAGLLTLAFMVIAFCTLVWIVQGYEETAERLPRRIGKLLSLGVAPACVPPLLVLDVFNVGQQTDACGNSSGWGTTTIVVLFVLAVVSFVLGISLVRQGAAWIALAGVAAADIGLLLLIAGMSGTPHRVGPAVAIAVHAVCVMIAATWARHVRAGTKAERAKGSEAGRTLAVAWPILAVLHFIDAADPVAHAVGSTTTASLFIIGALPLVMGTGYTKYAEASDAVAGKSARPDAVDLAVRQLEGWIGLTALLAKQRLAQARRMSHRRGGVRQMPDIEA